mgnify:FL=1
MEKIFWVLEDELTVLACSAQADGELMCLIAAGDADVCSVGSDKDAVGVLLLYLGCCAVESDVDVFSMADAEGGKG